MKIEKIKKSIIAIIIAILIIPTTVSAHTVTGGEESSGYILIPHDANKNPYFYWMPGTDQFWRDRLTNANNYMYSETSNNLKFINSTIASTENYIEGTSAPASTWVARVVSNNNESHKIRWRMQFNGAKKDNYSTAQWSRIAQHEMGHVFGLGDLKSSSNAAKLMYGFAGNYSGVTPADLVGLKKVWGF